MKKIILTILFVILTATICHAQYTNEQIADAIYYAEGGSNTKYPFGIKSVDCIGYDECRQICLNTIKNNRVRYAKYGYKQYDDFIEFLGSRYCPISDCPQLNVNWVRNVKWFLKNSQYRAIKIHSKGK